MAKTKTGVFPQDFFHDACVCTAAKTTFGDAANAVLLSTAGPNGSEYVRIAAMPRATVTATQLQLYAFDGANYFLVGSGLLAAFTMAQTVAIPTTALVHMDGSPIMESNPLRLQAGWKLYAAIGVALAAGIVFGAQRKDY